MTAWLGLDVLFIWIIRTILSWLVKAEINSDNADTLNLNPNLPVCFVLNRQSLSDYLVMDQACHKLGLRPPSAGLKLGQYEQKQAALYLTPKTWIWQSSKNRQALPKKLVRLVEEIQQHPDQDVQLVPVSVLWGRAPAREDSIFKLLFSENWGMTGYFKKLLIILIQGRETSIYFEEPVSIQKVVQENRGQERSIRKLARVFRTHFRWVRETVIGPDLSHRRTMVNALLRTPAIQEAIKKEAKRNDKLTEAKAEKQARQFAREIAADYSHSLVRVMYIALTWLWNKLYNGVQVNGIKRLKKVATHNEVIYVPCHRSHIDYLLLSYLLFLNNMVPPHIAAGVNLNIPVVGAILRRCGAFFLRRSFKGNRLYTAVFNEYLNLMFDRGFSVEYFIEGGRSRTGRLLPPRPGMLSMTVRSFLRTRRRNFVFVPVHISYEKVMEAGTYLNELYGKEKAKESIWGLFRATKLLKGNFGKVYVNFGNPIHLKDTLKEVMPLWDNEPYDDNTPPAWVAKTVENLGNDILTRINDATVIHPVNLISLTLLSHTNQAMDENSLESHLNFYLIFLRQLPYSNYVDIPNTNGTNIIQYCEKMGVIERLIHPLGNVIRLKPQQVLLMSYYRNNILHIFALFSLVACLALHNRRTERSVLIQQAKQLYPFIQSELFVHWPEDQIEQRVENYIDFLVKQRFLQCNEHEVWAPDYRSAEFLHLNALATTIRHSLERFFIVVEILLKTGSSQLQRNQLENACTLLAQRLSLLHDTTGPEYSDKTLFRNFIQALIRKNILQLDTSGALTFGPELIHSHEQAHSILGPEARQSIQQLAELDINNITADQTG